MRAVVVVVGRSVLILILHRRLQSSNVLSPHLLEYGVFLDDEHILVLIHVMLCLESMRETSDLVKHVLHFTPQQIVENPMKNIRSLVEFQSSRMESVTAVRYEVKMDDQAVAQELLPLSVSMHRQNRGTIPVKE